MADSPSPEKRLVNWSTVSKSCSQSSAARQMGNFTEQESATEILQKLKGLDEWRHLSVQRGRSEDDEHGDPNLLETTASDDGCECGSTPPHFPLPEGPPRGALESISEDAELIVDPDDCRLSEADDLVSLASSAEDTGAKLVDIGTCVHTVDDRSSLTEDLSRDQGRERRWSEDEVSDASPSKSGLSPVRRQLADLKLSLSPTGRSPIDSQDTHQYFSNCVWQKLETIEQRLNRMEVDFAEAIDLMQIRMAENLSDSLRYEEKQRKDLVDIFAAQMECQQKTFDLKLLEIAELHAVCGNIDASTGGTANGPPTVIRPLDSVETLNVALNAVAMERCCHRDEMMVLSSTGLPKLMTLGANAKSDSGETPVIEKSPNRQDMFEPVLREKEPNERNPVRREYSEEGHAGEEDVASEGSICSLRNPLLLKTVGIHG